MTLNLDERQTYKCRDCGVAEGELHDFGCDMEKCPFCGGQLVSCRCVYKVLGIEDRDRYTEETCFLPPDIYGNGVSDLQWAVWVSLCENKGRYPYIRYPVLCAMCGELWPGFFRVSDEEWQKYIQPSKQREVICLPCYEYIKEVTNK